MNIILWSDFSCPYCILGKQRLMDALQEAGVTDAQVEVKSFLLDPDPDSPGGGSMLAHLVDKGYSREQALQSFAQLTQAGREMGLAMDFDKAQHSGSRKAHCLFQYAKEQGKGAQVSDLLQRAIYMNGQRVDDDEVLLGIAAQAGLDREAARQSLSSDAYWQRANQEYEQAQQLGVNGVPFFVFEGKYGLSGAQPREVFLRAIQLAQSKEEDL